MMLRNTTRSFSKSHIFAQRTSLQTLRGRSTFTPQKVEHNHRSQGGNQWSWSKGGFFVGLAATGAFLSTALLSAESKDESHKVVPGVYQEGLPNYSKADVAAHKTLETGIWVYYKEGVYDITEFVEIQPGGRDKISLAAGSSIEPFWALYAVHKNEEVYEILEGWRIGNLVLTEEEKKQQNESKVNDPYANDPERSPMLMINSAKPFNAEPPAVLLMEEFFTPNSLFFVRNHLPVPEIHPEEYRLVVVPYEGAEPKVYTLDDLKQFPKQEISATIQCAGNRRDELQQVKPIKGLRWTGTAISNAQWGGVLLRDVLIDAGFDPTSDQVAHIQFEGLDTDGTTCYGSSIPVEKAISGSGDVMLAYEMNGETLPADHGFPVRAVVPGHVGARNVKWLGKIVGSKDESSSHWQQRDYRGFSPSVDWDNVDWDSAPSIQELPIQSLICSPSAETKISQYDDEIQVQGYAWSGGGRDVVRVELTIDGGETWNLAKLYNGTPDKKEPNANIKQVTKSPWARNWSWTLWKANVPIPQDLKGSFSLAVRAVDSSYNVQPEKTSTLWNMRGVVNNSWHQVPLHRE